MGGGGGVWKISQNYEQKRASWSDFYFWLEIRQSRLEKMESSTLLTSFLFFDVEFIRVSLNL